MRIFSELDLSRQIHLDAEPFAHFLTALDNGYEYYENPYHNSAHGTSVVFTLHYLLTEMEKRKERCTLTPNEMFAALIAGAIHDYRHPGRTNMFLV